MPYKIMQFTKGFQVPMVIGSIVILLGLIPFGVIVGGAQSWYQIGTFRLRPSEFVKLAVIIYLAAVYAKKQSYINQLNKGVLPPLIYLFIICGIIILQPDYGTAFIIVSIT